MRKIVMTLLAASAFLPAMASAQTAELHRDRRDIRQEQREYHQAVRHGDRRDIRDERRDVRQAQREYREDWRDYRRNHRDVYRRPVYVGPRGYAYRPIGAGYRLAPAYYGPRYTVVDYGRYRLPNPGLHRWVRYGNDVLLVNVRTGRVIEAHRSFFW
jgi:Ni/Co efflux regulator RcnB